MTRSMKCTVLLRNNRIDPAESAACRCSSSIPLRNSRRPCRRVCGSIGVSSNECKHSGSRSAQPRASNGPLYSTNIASSFVLPHSPRCSLSLSHHGPRRLDKARATVRSACFTSNKTGWGKRSAVRQPTQVQLWKNDRSASTSRARQRTPSVARSGSESVILVSESACHRLSNQRHVLLGGLTPGEPFGKPARSTAIGRSGQQRPYRLHHRRRTTLP